MDELEKEGTSVRADVEPGALQRAVELDRFSQQVRRDVAKSFPVYMSFFCLENSVREVVTERLAENHGADWWTSCVSSPIQKKVESRKDKEGANRWHIKRGASPIHYTDFGDLSSIIINNWEEFEDLFPSQDWIKSRLDELEASRNVIAHSNTLDQKEMNRVEMYLQDWLSQVG
jgi:hypothetical protein